MRNVFVGSEDNGGVLIGHLTAFCIGIATASYSLFFVFSGLTNLATVIGFGSFGLRGVYFLSTNLEEVLVETIKKLKKGTMRAKSRLRIQILRYHKNQKTLKTSFWLWSTTVSIWAIGSIMRILSFMDDRRLDDQGHQDYNILTAVVPFGNNKVVFKNNILKYSEKCKIKYFRRMHIKLESKPMIVPNTIKDKRR
eukprot:jgi/Bigna1/142316/aug1.69_g17024